MSCFFFFFFPKGSFLLGRCLNPKPNEWWMPVSKLPWDQSGKYGSNLFFIMASLAFTGKWDYIQNGKWAFSKHFSYLQKRLSDSEEFIIFTKNSKCIIAFQCHFPRDLAIWSDCVETGQFKFLIRWYSWNIKKIPFRVRQKKITKLYIHAFPTAAIFCLYIPCDSESLFLPFLVVFWHSGLLENLEWMANCKCNHHPLLGVIPFSLRTYGISLIPRRYFCNETLSTEVILKIMLL